MAEITVETLPVYEMNALMELADDYVACEHLDFQDLRDVQRLAQALRRVLQHLTPKKPVDGEPKKFKMGIR